MKKKYLLIVFIAIINIAAAQNTGIGTVSPDASSMLDITSTSRGLLIPRMSSSAIAAISNPAKGLLVYDSVNNQLMVNMGRPAIPNWQTIVFSSGWNLTGNSGIDTSQNFIGTKDKKPLIVKVNNLVTGILDTANNVIWGTGAGLLHPGFDNVVIGHNAYANGHGGEQVAIGLNALSTNRTGIWNTAVGSYTLANHKSNNSNTAIGYAVLPSDTSGSANTAVGFETLYSNINGLGNTVAGAEALYYNNLGTNNNAFGRRSLYYNTTGSSNTAIGNSSLYYNTDRTGLVAIGDSALFGNGLGESNSYDAVGNTAIGSKALFNNTIGYNNTATGATTLHNNTGGYNNTAYGVQALNANVNGIGNTAVGTAADVSTGALQNATAIGYYAIANASNKMQLGNTITAVIATASGYTIASDARFKDNIIDNAPGLSFITQLHPVAYNFNYKRFDDFLNKNRKEKNTDADYQKQLLEKTNHREIGFIAQEVEKLCIDSNYVFNGVYKPQNENDNYSLDYSKFVVPLVKAVQEQQVIIEQQNKKNEQQQQQIDALLKEIQLIKEKLK